MEEEVYGLNLRPQGLAPLQGAQITAPSSSQITKTSKQHSLKQIVKQNRSSDMSASPFFCLDTAEDN